MTALRALARYARQRGLSEARCELCAAPLSSVHAHAVDVDARRILCACRPCAILFTDPAAAGGRYRTVPDRVLVDPALAIDDARWEHLGVPVGLAFFFVSSKTSRWIACYPSPAGATEADLEPSALDAWPSRALIEALAPDVEALLVRKPRRATGGEIFLAPIDACYELVGSVRRLWRGFDGGDEVHAAIDRFFAGLRARSRPVQPGGAAQTGGAAHAGGAA